jgi:hypothetical protein
MIRLECPGRQSSGAFDRQDARLSIGDGDDHRCQFGCDRYAGGLFTDAMNAGIRHG